MSDLADRVTEITGLEVGKKRSYASVLAELDSKGRFDLKTAQKLIVTILEHLDERENIKKGPKRHR